MTEALAVQDAPTLPAVRYELTIDELVAQTKKIHEAMEKVMQDGVHYGVIPGTPKPTLLQPGAQKLNLLFRLDPQYHSIAIAPDLGAGSHLTIKSVCTLWHITTGQRLGSGEGSCSTREAKYAYRQARRLCPQCGKDAIIRGKEEYGGGWLCFKRREGCGAKFKDGDASIENQSNGRVPNEDLADVYNTVLKIANKRSLVAAVLNVTAAGDIFTQDLEDAPAVIAAPVVVMADEPIDTSADQITIDQAPDAGDRDILLGRIKALGDKLGLKAPERARLWQEHCGSADPRTVDPSALQDLYARLQRIEPKR